MVRISANLSTLFKEAPWTERFEAARVLGFDGVEIQFPYSQPAASLSRAARAAGLPVILINGPVDSPAHPLGIAGCSERRSEFRAQLPQILEYADALGVRYVHILAGRCESRAERANALRVYADNLSLAAEHLNPLGVEVLIEPLNASDAPGYLLGSFDLAETILRQIGPGIGLQFDIYHAARMRLDVAAELERRLPSIRHVQFADVPGRHQPGTGNLAFVPLIASLLRSGYAGWLGAEYFPSIPVGNHSTWLQEWRQLTVST